MSLLPTSAASTAKPGLPGRAYDPAASVGGFDALLDDPGAAAPATMSTLGPSAISKTLPSAPGVSTSAPSLVGKASTVADPVSIAPAPGLVRKASTGADPISIAPAPGLVGKASTGADPIVGAARSGLAGRLPQSTGGVHSSTVNTLATPPAALVSVAGVKPGSGTAADPADSEAPLITAKPGPSRAAKGHAGASSKNAVASTAAAATPTAQASLGTTAAVPTTLQTATALPDGLSRGLPPATQAVTGPAEPPLVLAAPASGEPALLPTAVDPLPARAARLTARETPLPTTAAASSSEVSLADKDGSTTTPPKIAMAGAAPITPPSPSPIAAAAATDATVAGAQMLAASPLQPDAQAGTPPPAAAPAPATAAAAQPLLDSVAGTGASRISAQATPASAGSKTQTVAPSRGKSAPATVVAKTPQATPSSVQPAAAPATAELALAAGQGPGAQSPATGDDDDAADAATPDASSQLGAAGFVPAAAPQPAGGAPAATVATPLSASAADLAAQMASKLAGGASRFKLELNPLGLGQVDVTVSIGADRQLTASLAFADARTASALSAHAGELKSVLEQAGFTVPAGGFAFSTTPSAQTASVAQAGGQALGGFGGGFGNAFGGAGGQTGGGRRSASTAFTAGDALAAADSAAWPPNGADSRLDIRI